MTLPEGNAPAVPRWPYRGHLAVAVWVVGSASLSEVLETASTAEVRAVVLTGAGRGFCAGVDLNPDPSELILPKRSRLRYEFGPLVLQLADLGKPIIAAVNGPAAGAGLGLAFAADLRLASATATFIPAFARIGSVPDMGVSYHLPRILGYERTLQWMLSGQVMTMYGGMDARDRERVKAQQATAEAQKLSAQLNTNLKLSLDTFDKVLEVAGGTGRQSLGVPMPMVIGFRGPERGPDKRALVCSKPVPHRPGDRGYRHSLSLLSSCLVRYIAGSSGKVRVTSVSGSPSGLPWTR